MPLVCIIFAPEKENSGIQQKNMTPIQKQFLHWCNQVYGGYTCRYHSI